MTEPTRIHVIDDDKAALESTGMLLGALGFEVTEWRSGSAFLAGCDPGAIDCVLLDSRMHGMSGERVLAEMTARSMAVPVIIMSGHAVPPDSQLGRMTFLEKPFSVADLQRAIQAARAAFMAGHPSSESRSP